MLLWLSRDPAMRAQQTVLRLWTRTSEDVNPFMIERPSEGGEGSLVPARIRYIPDSSFGAVRYRNLDSAGAHEAKVVCWHRRVCAMVCGAL
jgi:hypothetical protein